MDSQTNKCVCCGYCCTKGPCGAGKWNKDKHACEYLDKPNEYGQRHCLKYWQMKDDIMFGCGCSCSLFNTYRESVKRNLEELIPCTECGKLIKYKAEFCCSSKDCGCLGIPIDPPWCIDCWNKIMNRDIKEPVDN